MAQPRFAFWLPLGAAVWVAATALAAGALAAALALPVAAALLLAGLSASRDGEARAPRHLVGAGLAALAFAAVQLVAAPGAGAAASLVLAAAVIAAGARLSLEREPAAREGPVRSAASPGLTLAVAADESVRLLWDATRRLEARGSPRWVGERLRAAAERNRERGFLADPAAAHALPPGLEKPELSRESLRGLGALERLRFESEYEPLDPEARDAYLAVRPNRVAHAWLWRHAGGGRPALIAIHGYGGGRPALDARALGLARLHRDLGLDVALFALPLHGPRALGRRSGEGFFDGDPLWTSAALGQAVWDLRRLAGWLRAEGAPVVGALGMSLGGATTALLASVDGRLACAVPAIPAAHLARIVWGQTRPARRLALAAEGVGEALLDEAWATVAPLRHRPQVAPEGRLVLAAAADRICPPEHARALRERWDGCAVYWFAGSHLLPLGRGELHRRLDAHLRQTLVGSPAQREAPPLSRFRRA